MLFSLLVYVQEGKYAIVTDRWQKFTDMYLDEKILKFLASYADEFLVHGVDVEGKKYVPMIPSPPIKREKPSLLYKCTSINALVLLLFTAINLLYVTVLRDSNSY